MVCPLKISVFQFLCHFRVFLYQIMLFCAVFFDIIEFPFITSKIRRDQFPVTFAYHTITFMFRIDITVRHFFTAYNRKDWLARCRYNLSSFVFFGIFSPCQFDASCHDIRELCRLMVNTTFVFDLFTPLDNARSGYSTFMRIMFIKCKWGTTNVCPAGSVMMISSR